MTQRQPSPMVRASAHVRLLDVLGNLLTQPLRGLYLLGTLAIVAYRLTKRTQRGRGVANGSSGTAAMVMWQRYRGAELGFGPDTLARIFVPVTHRNDAPWVFEKLQGVIQGLRWRIARRITMVHLHAPPTHPPPPQSTLLKYLSPAPHP